VPGAHVLRRSRDEFQIGLGPGAAALPGTTPPDLMQLGRCPALLAPLVRAGLATTDDRSLRRVLPGRTEQPWRRHTVAALARRSGDRLLDVVHDRDAHLVEVVAFGHPLSRHLAADLADVCDRIGLRLAPSPSRRSPSEPPTARVLVGVGEPSRELVDPWLRDGAPHLLVRLVEGRAVVGPFVVPGRTACLRCIDAYRREEDPAWPLLVEQYSRATRCDRADGIPEPVDAALASVAVGWAVRELSTYAEGGEPASTSATITLSPLLDSVESSTWPPHPHCGCAW
jgi:bacteriocin biosynthesis cyclodehydratase domain-containing protein